MKELSKNTAGLVCRIVSDFYLMIRYNVPLKQQLGTLGTFWCIPDAINISFLCVHKKTISKLSEDQTPIECIYNKVPHYRSLESRSLNPYECLFLNVHAETEQKYHWMDMVIAFLAVAPEPDLLRHNVDQVIKKNFCDSGHQRQMPRSTDRKHKLVPIFLIRLFYQGIKVCKAFTAFDASYVVLVCPVPPNLHQTPSAYPTHGRPGMPRMDC